ncbi:MAG: SseB family protein [Chloroflexi bacterium]|nr:SseB family protein [Chloroflexota bacterium]MCC6897128.1 SseB family protein [Anaerolineae bacterium]
MFNFFRRKPALPENAELLNAIIKLATQETTQNRIAFYKMILKSDLLLAGGTDPSKPILLVDDVGRITLPVFTDVERVKNVYPDANRVGKLPVCDLFRLAVKNNYYQININPEVGPGAFLTFEEFGPLADGKIPDVGFSSSNELGEGTFVPMGDSKLPPEDKIDKMIQKARLLLAQEVSVELGFLILMGSNTGESRLTVALRARKGTDMNKLTAFSQKFVDATEAEIQQPMSLMWMDDESYASIRINSQPFYEK